MQLADVAGPRVAHHRLTASRAHALYGLAELSGCCRNEELGEEPDIGSTVTKGRHLDGHHVQPIEEVGSKPPVVYGLLEVPIGGSDHAHVDVYGLAASDGLELLLLEDAQQLDLRVGR